jgi:hypothetical protein
MQTHDPQEDEWYMLFTTLMTFHDVPDHNDGPNKTGNPGITTPEGFVKHMEGQNIPLIAGAKLRMTPIPKYRPQPPNDGCNHTIDPRRMISIDSILEPLA